MFQRLIIATGLVAVTASAQSFINGDFENHTFTGCAYNQQNSAFTAGMVGCVAYGPGGSNLLNGEIDVMDAGCTTFGPMGPLGPTRLGLAHNDQTPGWDAFTIELTSPLVVGMGYTISFWGLSVASGAVNGQGAIEFGTSPVAGVQGTVVATSGLLGLSSAGASYELHSVTFTATAPDQFISVSAFQHPYRTWNWIDGLVIRPANQAYCMAANGTGVNPNVCTCLVPPIVGGAWVVDVALTTNTILSVVYLSLEFSAPLALPWGELLINPPVSSFAGVPAVIPLPANPALLGLPAWAQAVRVENNPGGLVLELTNAQLGVLGN